MDCCYKTYSALKTTGKMLKISFYYLYSLMVRLLYGLRNQNQETKSLTAFILQNGDKNWNQNCGAYPNLGIENVRLIQGDGGNQSPTPKIDHFTAQQNQKCPFDPQHNNSYN